MLAAAAPVLGHAELVAGSPAPGEVLAESPTELRLVFSEPIEKGFSTLDLTTADGTSIVTAAGEPDPSDDHVLVSAVPALDDGSYTVVWRVLSKVDGHADVGTFAFSIASAEASPGSAPVVPAGPEPTSGHHGTVETQGRILLYAGQLIAFGLAIVAWVVLEPGLGRVSPAVGRAIGVGLVVAGVGAALMLLASGLGLVGPAGRPDLVGYATSSRPGILLLARVGLGIVGGIVVLLLVRGGRMEAAIDVGALAATAGIAITVASGHAAVFEPPVTIAVWFVHASAAGVWLAGLGTLAVVASRRPTDPVVIRAMVSRYSALALVAISLVVLTGAYQEWVEVDGLPSADDPYGRLLIVKIAVAAAAFGFGVLNYLDGGRLIGWLGGLGRRATVETFLAAVVIVVTASLVAIPPPGPGRPIELATPPDSGAPAPLVLAVSPGRPGPNRFTAVARDGFVPTTITLETSAGSSPIEVAFRPSRGDDRTDRYVADVRNLGVAAWRANVVLDPAASVEYPFVMAPDGVAAGRAVLPADPALILGLLMLLAGIFGVAYARSGGTLPRVDRAAARIAMTGGGLAAAVAGFLVVALGPRI